MRFANKSVELESIVNVWRWPPRAAKYTKFRMPIPSPLPIQMPKHKRAHSPPLQTQMSPERQSSTAWHRVIPALTTQSREKFIVFDAYDGRYMNVNG